jgi:putative transposase
MRHRLYLHLVWTTLDRAPLIDAACARFLTRYLRAITAEERARVLAVGIVATHVHLLLATHPSTNLPRLIQRLKGASARIANREGHAPLGTPLRWAEGYNVQTVSLSLLGRTREYVLCQADHHPNEAIPNWDGDTGVTEWREVSDSARHEVRP